MRIKPREWGAWKPRQERALRKRGNYHLYEKLKRKIRTEKSTGFGNTKITCGLDLRSVSRKIQTETGIKCNEEKTLTKTMYTTTKDYPLNKGDC